MNFTLRKNVLWSSGLGATFAWYDFIIFNIAIALIFPSLFFPDMGYLIPILVFSVGFLARPIGSLLFGIVGDRFGRRTSLVYTLYVTGLATVAIGLLPTHGDIGIAATVLLILFRILQTAAFGGEWSAASTMIVEHHADHANKGLMASLISSGWPIAIIMASAMFMLVNSFGNEFFVEYGWRIPFLFSVFLLLIGVYVRRRVIETPQFETVIKNNTESKFDLIKFFKIFKRDLLIGAAAFQLSAAWAYIIMIFGFGYVLQNGLVTRIELTQIQFMLSWVLLFGILFWGWLGDKIGCKNVFYIGVATSLFLTVPVFLWLEQGNIALAYACLVFLNCPAFACAPKLFCDQYPTEYRQTGSGVTFNLGVVLGAGFVPIIAQQILVTTNSLVYVAALMFVLTVISLIATMFIKKN
jgi:MFS family permease